jgi:cytochrome c
MASSLEFNKALAAVLTAGIIASGAGVFSRIIYHPDMPAERAYPIDMAAVEEAGGEAAEGQEEAMELSEVLAMADPAAGETTARKCAACHTFGQGEANKIGPNLHGVLGRDIASLPDFSYSSTLTEKEGVWDYESLDHFVADPKGWAAGTKMTFAGIKKQQERGDLLLYLRSLSDNPPSLPEGG